MKTWLVALSMAVAAASLPLASFDAEAKRLGGGKAAGMQRQAPAQSSPSQSQTPPSQQPGQTAPVAGAAAPAAAGATAAAAAGKRSWLGPVAGLAAGLGLAALASHLGFGAELANFMTMLLLGIVAFIAIRFLMRRFAGGNANAQRTPGGLQMTGAGAAGGNTAFDRAPEPMQTPSPMQRQAFDGAVAPAGGAWGGGGSALPADFDSAGFQRIAKMLFIRMQAANDGGQVEDIRKFTTPELFASLRLDLQERGNVAQQTDVVQLDADLADYAEERGQQVVSVRFHGLIREEAGAGAQPFNELWHFVRPSTGGDWAIAGIQPL